MKRYTTRFLKTVALAYMAFPVTYLFACGLIYDIPASQCLRILLAPSFYFLSFIAAIAGYGLWEVRLWAWYLFLATNILVVYSNALIAANFSESHHPVLAFLSMSAGIIALLFEVGREISVPYFLPKIRWWESNPRYRLAAPATILVSSGGTDVPVLGDILDISMGGCFIKLKSEIAQHESLVVRFTMFGVQIDCPGTVVWCTQSTVTHPKGIGVKFGPLPRKQRRALRAMTRRLKQIQILYRSSRYLLTPEEFTRRLDRLQTEKIEIASLKA